MLTRVWFPGNVLAIMTAVARLIAFHRIKKDAREFQASVSFTNWIPVTAMGAGVLSYIAAMVLQSWYLMETRTFHIGLSFVLGAFVLWMCHEGSLIYGKLKVKHHGVEFLQVHLEKQGLQYCLVSDDEGQSRDMLRG